MTNLAAMEMPACPRCNQASTVGPVTPDLVMTWRSKILHPFQGMNIGSPDSGNIVADIAMAAVAEVTVKPALGWLKDRMDERARPGLEAAHAHTVEVLRDCPTMYACQQPACLRIFRPGVPGTLLHGRLMVLISRAKSGAELASGFREHAR
jgi:hypothetical protein